MSISSLLQTTNQRRAENGAGALTNNAALNAAAQAKANDMMTRDYWSHNTPDGNPPWVFIDNAGYAYQKAGENLAYGFATGEDTVAGWMNSPSHKDNMLNIDYKDVGFGFVNAPNFVGTGNETIVVAEYGTPLVGASAPVAVAPAPPAAAPQTKAVQQTIAPAPVEETPVAAEPTPVQETTVLEAPISQAVTTDNKNVSDPPPVKVSRLAALTGGRLAWLTTAVSITTILAGAILVIKHGLAVRKWLVRSEKYVLHHVVFDVTIVSLLGLCTIVSQTAGVIR
jgi:hypothetical protein